jgi:hypothetical protein
MTLHTFWFNPVAYLEFLAPGSNYHDGSFNKIPVKVNFSPEQVVKAQMGVEV